MKNGKSLRIAFGAVLACATGVATASPGTAILMQSRVLMESGAGRAALFGVSGRLENPGSYIRVRPASEARVAESSAVVRSDGSIVVPANARAGDPAFDEPRWDELDGQDWIEVEVEPSRAGMIIADGIELQYSTLHRPESRPRWRQRQRAWERANLDEFGAHDLHRSAQLEFSEAAQPRLRGMDDAWRRAQLRFHGATLTTPPGARRGSDGLRHERTSPGPDGRTRW